MTGLLFIPFLLLSIAVHSSNAVSIQPTFTCWFNTYDTGSARRNIIMGYKPTNDVTSGSLNVITPLSYNGSQPSVYGTTINPFATTIRLITETPITWTIDGLSRTVGPTDWIEANRCINSAYSFQCPTSIINFCEDGSYCNGNEICFPDVIGGPVGACHHTTEVVVCSGNLICNDTVRACVSPVTVPPPTVSPTGAPTTKAPTQSPTRLPTTVPPTFQPTPSPTVATNPPPRVTEPPRTTEPTRTNEPTQAVTLPVLEEEEDMTQDVSCQVDEDCATASNFCKGPYVCNQFTGTCVPSDVRYDPCQSFRSTLRDYYASVNATTFPISITCSEAPQLCIESFTCQTNMDCSDNLVCNGVELCIAGQCYYQRDQSLAAVCRTNLPVTCTEPDGCSLVEPLVLNTTAPTYNHTHHHHHNGISPTILGLVVGAVVLVGLVILVCILYFEFNTSSEPIAYAPVTMGRRITISSRLRAQMGYGKYRGD